MNILLDDKPAKHLKITLSLTQIHNYIKSKNRHSKTCGRRENPNTEEVVLGGLNCGIHAHTCDKTGSTKLTFPFPPAPVATHHLLHSHSNPMGCPSMQYPPVHLLHDEMMKSERYSISTLVCSTKSKGLESGNKISKDNIIK